LPNQCGIREGDFEVISGTARDIFDQMAPSRPGNRQRLVKRFLRSDRIVVAPAAYAVDDLHHRLLLTLKMSQSLHSIWANIRYHNSQALVPVFDNERPLRSTEHMPVWYTRRSCERTKRSHISHCVFDSRWEASETFELDRNKRVAVWVKNDHQGFEILYTFKGVVQKYRPDFLIRLVSGLMLILEIKGQDTRENRTKREFLNEWVRAINGHGGFGQWGLGHFLAPGRR
jgi:type III restriction enzyme